MYKPDSVEDSQEYIAICVLGYWNTKKDLASFCRVSYSNARIQRDAPTAAMPDHAMLEVPEGYVSYSFLLPLAEQSPANIAI